jgi:formate dehydrogenase subunit beta
MTQRFMIFIDQDGVESTIRKILAHVWLKTKRRGILIPAVPSGDELPSPTFLETPEDLSRSALLAPYMPYNAAASAVELLDASPGSALALALKPCELRSLRQFARQNSLDLSTVITISSDCLAVFPPEDIGWRLGDEAIQNLTEEVLRFAPQGGILLSRFQQSCQVCERPYPVEADVQFELIGLDASKNIIVSITDPAWFEAIEVQFEPVDPDLLEKRDRILENLVNWRSKALSSAGDKLDPGIASPEGLIDHLKACPDCQGQLEAMCLQYDDGLLYSKAAVEEWVGTCSGCGTCDYQCPSNYPLFTVIAYLNDRYAQRENNRVH